jgi:hypothetical protein
MRMTPLAMIIAATGIACVRAAAPPPANYRLVWADEFDGQALDLRKWEYRGLGPRRDAVNVKDCVALDGHGHLVLTTKRVGNEYRRTRIPLAEAS